jgi:hypothetical protein|tara:strand:- start:129 stop:362 length:234 start_codon:yes stop_codon:yes gene_type:complete
MVFEVIVNYENNNAEVRMSLTSPGCPYGPEIFSAVGMVSKTLGFHEKKMSLSGICLENRYHGFWRCERYDGNMVDLL